MQTPEKVKLEGGNLKKQKIRINRNVESKKLWSSVAMLGTEAQALLETQSLAE